MTKVQTCFMSSKNNRRATDSKSTNHLVKYLDINRHGAIAIVSDLLSVYFWTVTEA